MVITKKKKKKTATKKPLQGTELEALVMFVFKVSMEGFSYALRNYLPDELPTAMRKKFLSLPTLDAEAYLEELMREYALDWS